jgi:hypothetical protein
LLPIKSIGAPAYKGSTIFSENRLSDSGVKGTRRSRTPAASPRFGLDEPLSADLEETRYFPPRRVRCKGGLPFGHSAAAKKAKAIEWAKALAPILTKCQGTLVRQTAAGLDSRKVAIPTGAPWSVNTVIRVRERVGR